MHLYPLTCYIIIIIIIIIIINEKSDAKQDGIQHTKAILGQSLKN